MPVRVEDLRRERIRRERERRANRPAPPGFRGVNAAFLADNDTHELMLSGPAETGKTFTACAKLHTRMATTPHAKGVMIRKTYASLIGTAHETLKHVLATVPVPDGHGGHALVRPAAYGGEKPEWYDYPNGSRLYLGGMDNAQKVLSGERDFIYVCQAEELDLTDWETLTTRATGRAGATDTPQVFGDCNPGPPTHWILHRPALRILESRHVDNPRLYDLTLSADGKPTFTPTARGERSLRILASLTGVLRERLYLGRWVAAEGLVYHFDKAIHLIDPFPIPPSWRRYQGIDFGFTNPFVALWAAIDDDGRLHVYRQHYRTGMLVADHAQIIKDAERWGTEERERIAARLADHDAEDRATLARAGIGTVGAIKDVRPGIESVETRLRVAGDGRPRLFVHRDSLIQRDDALAERRQPINLEQEFDLYAYPKAADGKAIKEAPIKLYDHALDPLRYICLWLDRTGGASSGELR